MKHPDWQKFSQNFACQTLGIEGTLAPRKLEHSNICPWLRGLDWTWVATVLGPEGCGQLSVPL
jgi:hypothetical protein